MLNIYDSEAIIKIYRLLQKRCDVIDRFIKNHAYYFGPYTEEYGAVEIYNSIIELMERKNQLINLKIIVDSAVSKLGDNDRKILLIKMKYNLSMVEICGILELKERTAFRRIEQAFSHLTDELNRSNYIDKLYDIIEKEEWIVNIRHNVMERRQAYRSEQLGLVNNL